MNIRLNFSSFLFSYFYKFCMQLFWTNNNKDELCYCWINNLQALNVSILQSNYYYYHY